MAHLDQHTKPRLSFRLPLEPIRLLRARERIRDYLHEQRVDPQAIDDVVLALDEAMTNAVRHSEADRDLEVEVRLEDDDLAMRVRDHGKGFETDGIDYTCTPELLATGGRGLFLIRQLMGGLELRCNGGVEVRAVKRDVLSSKSARAAETRRSRVMPGGGTYWDERERALLDEVGERVALFDWEYRYVFANKALIEAAGRPPSELLGRSVWEVFPAFTGTPQERALRDAMELGRSSVLEHENLVTGEWQESRFYPTAGGVSTFSRVITERKRKELERDELFEALRESEQRLRMATAATGLGVQDYDVRSGAVRWDDRVRELWGIGPDEPVSYETFIRAVHPDDREAIEAAVQACMDPAGSHSSSTTYRVVEQTDGGLRWLRATWETLFDDGEAVRMIGTVEDVSERRQAEERLRRTLDSLLDPHVLLEAVRDEEGNIVDFVFADANPAACRFNGLRYEELVGARLLGLHPAAGTTELFDMYVKLVETGEPLVLDEWSYPQDLLGGERRRYDVRAARVGDGLSQTWRDVTERRLAEAALRERARLAAAQARVEALVHSSLDDEEIIAAALREGAEAIGAETAGLSLHEDAEGRFRVAYIYNYPPDKIGVLIPDEADTHGVEAMRTGQTIAIDDTQTDPRVVRELMEDWDIKSVICAPLVVRGQPIGVVYYNYHSAAHQFTYQEIDFVTALAASLASALQNARLYAEQSNIALTLQRAFVHPLPRLEGLELGVVGLSASEPALVGGDFCDVFALPDDKVLIAIGDVAGKGIQATALTETVHSTMRAFARVDDSPAFILRKTSELLMGDDAVETFVTALVAVMDRRSGAVRLASAGHPGPIHVSTEGCGVLDPPYRPPLGSFPAEYASTTVQLALGDSLVLHTDGVTEARTSGLLFGEDNAVGVVSAHRGESAQEVADALASAAASYADELKDDLQVLVIRRVS